MIHSAGLSGHALTLTSPINSACLPIEQNNNSFYFNIELRWADEFIPDRTRVS
jgi:hypothetical protein